MRKRARTSLFDRLIAKVLVWVAGRAIETVPVIGPIVKAVKFVNDVAEIRRAYAYTPVQSSR
jgi:hypothetical protein